MARARNIKPSFFMNEDLGQADPLVSLLFISLWCLADREGRLEDRPLKIKAQTFPYREISDFNGYLTVIERLGLIERYSVDGIAYIQVVNFKKHQSPHNTEKASDIPSPEKKDIKNSELNSNGDLTVNSRKDFGGNTPDSLIPDSLIPENNIVDSCESPAPENKAPKFTADDRNLAEHMLTEIRKISPSAKATKSWPDDIRLMRERDGHTLDEIKAMFAWANADPFWSANILSPSKLRDKWAQLEAQRNRPKTNQPQQRQSAHGGFASIDYTKGINADGSF